MGASGRGLSSLFAEKSRADVRQRDVCAKKNANERIPLASLCPLDSCKHSRDARLTTVRQFFSLRGLYCPVS